MMSMCKRTLSLLVVTMLVLMSLLSLVPVTAETDAGSTDGRAMSRTSAESEPNNDYDHADEVSAGDVVSAKLNWSDNDDVYKINLTAGKVFNVSIYLEDYNPSNPWEHNIDFEVLTPDKWIITAHWWQETRIDTYSLLAYETGFHYLWVYANGTQGGDTTLETNYTLGVNETDPIDAMTGTYSGSIDKTTDHYTDVWYKMSSFDPAQGIRAALTVPATGDLDLYLYNWWPYHRKYVMGTAHPFILNASWARTDGGEEVVEGLAMEGTYYLKINAFSGSGSYSLDITEASFFDDGDSTPDTATVVNKSMEIESHLHQSDDYVDFYRIPLEDGENFNVTVELTSDLGNVVFYVTILDQWKYRIGNIGVYDTNDGSAWSTTNPVDNSAVLTNVPYIDGSAGAADYYVYVRAVFRLYQQGQTNFIPVDADYRITWDLPNYGPETTGVIPDIEMDEDTVNNELNLNDYFQDPEGEDLTFSYSPGTIHNISVAIDQATGMVNITPAKDYNTDGEPVNITFRATDPDADWGVNSASLGTTISIDPINDAPRVAISMVDVTMKEGEVTSANPSKLNKVFKDVDGDNLLYRASGFENVPVEIDQNTTSIILGPAVQWFGNETITVTAEDPDGEKVRENFTVNVEHENHKPRVVDDMTTYTHEITEDTFDDSLDVTDLFVDNDTQYAGDSLNYYIDYPLGYTEPFHMEVELNEDNHLEITPEENFTGTEEVPVFAIDDSGSNVMLVVNIHVLPVNDPPVIKTFSPGISVVEMEEGQSKRFTVDEVEDVDDENLRYRWYINDEFQSLIQAFQNYIDFETHFTAGKGKHPAGEYELRVAVGDGDVNDTWAWTINVTNVNRAPTGVSILEPSQNAKFTAGDQITLRAASVSDPDGDTVTYVWKDLTTNEDLGQGESILFKSGKKGDHKIQLTVTDGQGANVTSTVTVKVTEDKEDGGLGGGLMLYGLLGIIIVVVVIVLILMMMKRKGGAEPSTPQDVADSYEAQLWAGKPGAGSGGAGGGGATTQAPPPTEETPPTRETLPSEETTGAGETPPVEETPAVEGAPPTEEETGPATWSPGGTTEDTGGVAEEPAAGPPEQGQTDTGTEDEDRSPPPGPPQ